MRAGGMRERITIQSFTSKRLPSGQNQQVWSDTVTIWAEVKGISGRELIASNSEMAEVTYRMWVRYRPEITTASRVLWKQEGRDVMVYGIVSVLPDARASRLELLCKGGVKP